MKRKIVEFKNIDGRCIPLTPFPQSFFISEQLADVAIFKIRPMTLSNFLRATIKNFVSMNYWRIKYLLFKIGFIECSISDKLSFKHFTFNFLKVLRKRKVL